MKREPFDKLVQATVAATADLLVKKGAEYADNADRLANFKRNAKKNGQTVLDVWQTYWGKHVDAINTYMARVKDEAVKLALEEVCSAWAKYNTEHPTHVFAGDIVDPVKFRQRVDAALPDAMRTIDAQLSEPIGGRFHDNINYSFLCLAILEELRSDGSHFDGRPGAL